MEYLDKLLEELTKAVGIGYSGNVKEVVYKELETLGIETSIKEDSSIYGVIKGKKERGVMIACHIDEVGFIISSIDGSGRLSLSQIGSTDISILPGQEVVVHGSEQLNGYIGAKPPHLVPKEEREKVLRLDELFVDTGLRPERVKEIVKIGDIISFRGVYQKLQGDLRTAKSLDNRASVACGILALRELAKIENEYTIYFVATSQEEFSGMGAKIHAFRLPIDYGIVVDVSFGEHPDLKDHEYYPLNKGPVISRGATIPEKSSDMLISAAKELKIPYQIEPVPAFSGTDADDIAFNREGIPTCIIGIPLRYMHTPVEVVALGDIEKAKSLIIAYINKLIIS